MAIEINPQINLQLGLAEPDSLLGENAQAELVEELANLIILFWETANTTQNISEVIINE